MNVAYAYPWDIVGDPAAPQRLADLGVEAVALAASYHSTRAATPFHPSHRVLDVPHAAFYLPVRPSAWGRLAPLTPTWTAPDAYLRASEALRSAGLQVHAWTVLTHNSALGAAHPDLVVRNAFGDPYPHALCPAFDDVVDYCERLVREVLTVGRPDALILEACGPMGFGHQSIHEKTSGADWTATDADLLSLCFCSACADRYPSGTRDRVRAAIDSARAEGHPRPDDAATAPVTETTTPASAQATAPTSANAQASASADARASTSTDVLATPSVSIEDALGPLADEVRAARVGLSTSLRSHLIAVARDTAPRVPITVHANPDPWAVGAFAPLPDGEPGAEVLVANCWGDPAADSARLARLAELCAPGQRVGAYVLGLPPRPADAPALADLLNTYAKAGAAEFHLYHAGLASPRRLAVMAEALRLTR
ncbi:hypothetical protein AB0C18_07195 [Nonomuraea muscovyensis]|uniref:hypothetical protein n=1 Tax=Nonomuraea muscovyensis TaxID=1124761 RepID=UPI0033C6BC19|nr:hypothetical protein [Nonomuraea muscovyensis]